MSRPRVVVVDDHALFRAGVNAELGDRVEVVGSAEDVSSAIEVIGATRPDVVLLDVHLPGGDGAAVMEGLRGIDEVRYLALSVSDAADDVIALVRAGARGYVTKSITADELCDAVDRVAAGDAVFSPRLAGFVLDAFSTGATDVATDGLDQLSPREREVLGELIQGHYNKTIAEHLGITARTVEFHRANIFEKMGVESAIELAHQLGRLTPIEKDI